MTKPLNWRMILGTPEYGWPADLIADAKAARSDEVRQLLPAPKPQPAPPISAAEISLRWGKATTLALMLSSDEAERRRYTRTVRLILATTFAAGLLIGGGIGFALYG